MSNITHAPKIYFAGSIRGGRADAELYKRIITYLQQQLGCKVLTEHVGDLSLSQKEGSKPINNSQGGPTNPECEHTANEACSQITAIGVDQAIYLQDTGWLKESDIVIAECTTASLGVGYELAYAEKLGKPVHIFYNSERIRLSAMLTGNTYFHIHPYIDEKEIYPILDSLI